MKTLKLNPLAVALLSVVLIASLQALAQDTALPAKPEARNEATESVQPQVDAEATDQAAERRKKVTADAVAAVNETKNALKLLDDKKTEEALAALERATGKLELILAREPTLALAPVDVEVVTYDLLADLDTIKAVIKNAEDYLEDGEIQKARPLVADLASEIEFRTVSIPLATYPAAIKAVAPLIEEGKLDEAKVALQAVLNTLVVTTDVVPLPILRAEILLRNAEALAENKERTDKDNETLASQLAEARHQIKMAELLGYGDKKAFKPIYEQIDQIEEKASNNGSGQGWFDKIKQQLSDLI
ncbi:YfdX protein [Roseomonas sp. TAS13]|uniref:YfdX family protein n=1 Tax=Roseomonas TaxID=125216 RepID=UPI0009650903|nr:MULTISPECIES: YfdX family protein [Roseomonas]MCG7353068.1 YfdX family protein [Roseomonas mucosa]MCG7358318.1 YfdX family protein [Roseomonas mucosa]GAV33355.1 YfdX protein [Roseomonas sp. TAS13]